MVSCACCGCALTKKNKALKVTFHSFPKDANRRQVWINFLRKPEWIPKSSSVLCSRHFAEQCFDRTSLLKVRLLPNAVPTIEVNRLKYVRNFNPVHTKPVEEDELAKIFNIFGSCILNVKLDFHEHCCKVRLECRKVSSDFNI